MCRLHRNCLQKYTNPIFRYVSVLLRKQTASPCLLAQAAPSGTATLYSPTKLKKPWHQIYPHGIAQAGLPSSCSGLAASGFASCAPACSVGPPTYSAHSSTEWACSSWTWTQSTKTSLAHCQKHYKIKTCVDPQGSKK